MLTMAKVTRDDLVVDLGAGDGRIPIVAAKEYGARSVGIEYDPEIAKLASCLVEAEGAAGKACIVQGDIFKEDFSDASVVTMSLLLELNVCVRHRILAHAARHARRLAPVQHGRVAIRRDGRRPVPQRAFVGGSRARRWRLGVPRGKGGPFTADLNQTFGTLGGEVVQGADRRPVHEGKLRGQRSASRSRTRRV
jgi:SAM-dependent methyltransferase